MTTCQLLSFDKEILSTKNLFFRHFKKRWNYKSKTLLVTGILLFVLSTFQYLYGIKKYMSVVPFITGASVLLLAFLYRDQKFGIILKWYSMKYKLDIANTYWKCWVFYIPQWTPEEIEKLHLALLLDWLKGETLTIDQAKVLIEYFRNESRKPVYKFSTAKAFSILFTILAGSFFTMLVATDIGKLTYENLISILKTMTGISLLFLITLHYLEKTILQPNFQKRISRYDRLIRVLTNYILHRQQSDAPTIFNPTLKVVR